MHTTIDDIITFKIFSKKGISIYAEKINNVAANKTILLDLMDELSKNLNTNIYDPAFREKEINLRKNVLFGHFSSKDPQNIYINERHASQSLKPLLSDNYIKITNYKFGSVNIVLEYLLHYYSDVINNNIWFNPFSFAFSNELIDAIQEAIPFYEMINFPKAYGLQLLESIWLNPQTLGTFSYDDFKISPQNVFSPDVSLPAFHYAICDENLIQLREKLLGLKDKVETSMSTPIIHFLDFLIQSDTVLVLIDNRSVV